MQTLPDPAATISAQGASPQPILSATQDALPVTSDALPMLTPILQSKPGTLPPVQKPSLPHPHASPKIKPPPGSGSQSLKQPALPLWQMFGSASNRPALKVGMLAGGESLDLNVLAKAAVRKRKEQVRIAFQPELLVQAVAAMHSALLLDAIDLHCCVNCYRACIAYGWALNVSNLLLLMQTPMVTPAVDSSICVCWLHAHLSAGVPKRRGSCKG